MKKKILLTGGNGFIGKNIQESFLSQKYEICAPRSFELNLIDTKCTDEFFKDKTFDVVLHAGVKPGHRNAKDTTNLFYSNLRMFENLERHQDKFEKLINFGSGAVYDVSDNISDVSETEIFSKMPVDEHGFCKYVEHKLIQKNEKFLDMNIFGIFGKYEDYSIRFISNAICKSLFDLPITLKQNRRFSYLFVDDLMPILELFIENRTRFDSYNIVPSQKIELAELADLIRTISGNKTHIEIAQDGYGKDYTGNNSRLLSEFDKISFTKIEDSVCKLYNYYKNEKANGNINIELLLTDK